MHAFINYILVPALIGFVAGYLFVTLGGRNR